MNYTKTRKLIYHLEYKTLISIIIFLRALPEPLLYLFAKALALFVYHCLRIRRRETIANLRQALGAEVGARAINDIARQSYINIGMTFIELLLLPTFKKRLFSKVSRPDLAMINQYIPRNHGLIMVSCHLGNWELNGASVAMAGLPLTVVAARLSNPYLDEYINRMRSAMKMKVVPSDSSTKDLVRALKRNEVIGLISDQNAGRHGVFVDFFGRPASTPKGAAVLALKYKAPIMVSITIRTRPGHYKSFFRAVEVLDDDDVKSLTQRYTAVMEEFIRQYPAQYLWMHRRWKTRPPEEASGV